MLQGRFDAALARLLPAEGREGGIGVAVSGGGDSTCLLALAADWGRRESVPVRAVSIDHGLRAEAAGEIDKVRVLCGALGVSHDVKFWRGWSGRGNLQAAAREARYGLIAEWAGERGVRSVLLGHTQDDQAETFLMRLARGAGVDGLSAMAARRIWRDIAWLRPLLGFRRAELRQELKRRAIDWSEDPSNEDRRFDRVRVRQVLADLEQAGIGAEQLARTALRMQDARRVLEQVTDGAAVRCARVVAGAVVFDRAALFALEGEIIRRLVQRALVWVSGAPYAPRGEALSRFIGDLADGKTATLHGCIGVVTSAEVAIGREFAAVKDLRSAPGQTWDGRWRVCGPCGEATIAAAGEAGLEAIEEWRKLGLPRQLALALPAVWHGNVCLALPGIASKADWQAELTRDAQQFFTSSLSH